MVYGKYKFDSLDKAKEMYESVDKSINTVSRPRRVVLSDAEFEGLDIVKDIVVSDYAILDILWREKEDVVFSEFEQDLDNEGLIGVSGVSYLKNKR